MSKITELTILPYGAAVIASALSGVIEMVQPQLLVTVLFILGTGLAIGLIWWRQSWKYGLIIGLGVPIAYIFASVFGYHAASPAQPNPLITLAALLPGVTGTATGSMLRIAYDEGKAKR